jgi:hypothetical protein
MVMSFLLDPEDIRYWQPMSMYRPQHSIERLGHLRADDK